MPSYHQATKKLSGIRFAVKYSFFGPEAEVVRSAAATCVEQTIEFPPNLLPENEYWGAVQGQIEAVEVVKDGHFHITISYAVETTSPDIVQVLNVIYGNIAMIRDIRVEEAFFPPEMLAFFQGPRFGLEGIRRLTGVYGRPLICATIKPMGLSLDSFAEIAYEAAMGGADFVKDDHGLTDQDFTRFETRVTRCAEAILQANERAGGNCLYAPHISAPADQIVNRARFAKQAGSQALLIIPGLVGWDVVRLLSEDTAIDLPIICHPSYFGVYNLSERAGFSASFAYGTLQRLAGGDVSIMPNYIGRLHSTKEDCRNAVRAARQPMGNLKPILSAPGGGITLETIPELLDFYDEDVLYVVGGGLHSNHALQANCRQFREMVEDKFTGSTSSR